MNRPWSVESVAAVTAGVLALAGCGPSPEDVRAEARSSRDQVTRQARELLDPLAAVGTFAFSYGAWSGCGDFGGKAVYEVTGRLDPPPGDDGVLLDRVVDRLAATGLRMRRVHPQDKDPVAFGVRQDGVTMEVYGSPLDSYVLVDVLGPCLDVDDLDRELIDAARTPLGLGGS